MKGLYTRTMRSSPESRATRRYAQLGIPRRYLEAPQNYRILHEILTALVQPPANGACDISPTSFDPNDPELKAFPRLHNWRWKSCETALRAFGSRGVMSRLPLYWQSTFALHRACRAVGIPLFTNDLANMPLGAAALRGAGVDTVVCESGDAAEFAAYLERCASRMPLAWIIVHRVGSVVELSERIRRSPAGVAQEVHLLPGFPILIQCPALMREQKAAYHAAEGSRWRIEPNRSFVSFFEEWLPFVDFETTCRLRERGTCPCGKTILELQSC